MSYSNNQRGECRNRGIPLFFADCIQRREWADFDGLLVPVIAVEDLIQNKRASGRHKDLADIEGLNRDET